MGSGLTYARTCTSEADTDQLATSLAPLLRPGDVFALNGTLGAGKTRFVQGVAHALGVESEVTSPTFTIHAVYHGNLELNHFDLYRLETEDELEDIGYWEALESDGVSFVEWADKFEHTMPSDYIEMRFSINAEGQHVIKAHACGERSRRLLFLWAKTPDAQLQELTH